MALRKALATAGVAAAMVGGGLAAAPSASALTMSPTFKTMSGCLNLRAQYVKDGGFSYISPCAKRNYGLYYFLYD